MAPNLDETDVPTLAQKHSGIPDYLLDKARHQKKAALDLRTKPPVAERQRPPALPQGVDEAKFRRALDELRQQLGSEHVEVNDKPLVDGWYMEHPNTHDMMTVVDQEEFVASAVVYPGGVEDVQKIVRWANNHVIPIFPISMGRNLGYGGAAPRVRGSVTIDLGRRMNSILDISAEDYTCLLEPGVSFYALHDALKQRGLDKHMWVDVPDLGGGSVVGNTLDRGVGYTPYGDHWACHSGLEIVLPTGEVIRTGMGALPGSNTWQAFPYGFGPYSDGIFSQSNFGIVTKMGMTLMPHPGEHESFMYTFQKESDLAQLIEIIRPLRIAMILENVSQLRGVVQAIAVQGKPRSHYYQGAGSIPQDVVRAIAAKTLSPAVGDFAWVYYGTTYGPETIRKYKLDIIDREFHRVPGCRRIDPAALSPDDYFWVRDQVSSAEPEIEELTWVNWVPNGAHIAFSPVSPIRGADANALYDLCLRRHEEFGIDFFPAFIVGLREMHIIVEIVFDRADPARRKAALACLRAMVDDAAKLGYGEYRTHLAAMDQVAATYSFNDGALLKFNERLKDCLDPNGILAPGKSGVWPKRYRGRGWEMVGAGKGKDKETSEGRGVAAIENGKPNGNAAGRARI